MLQYSNDDCVILCRAVNNGLLDTYQLKSLDGVTEAPVETLRIRRRNGKHYVYIGDWDMEFSSNVTNKDWLIEGERPQTYETYDNYAMREPYDRVIRCLGFKFNESLFSPYV